MTINRDPRARCTNKQLLQDVLWQTAKNVSHNCSISKQNRAQLFGFHVEVRHYKITTQAIG